MMFNRAIIHISDLHRAGNIKLSNELLLSSFDSDIQRFQSLNPKISKPSALIVTGDLIYGSPLGDKKYKTNLENQYKEAFKFLADFSDKFLEGDRTKVIVLPGNHDVNWNELSECFEIIYDSKIAIKSYISNFFKREKVIVDINKLLFNKEIYRWDWKNLRLLKVRDINIYRQKKFEVFQRHLAEFYKNTNLQIDYSKGWASYSLFENNCSVVCFSTSNFIDQYSSFASIEKEHIHNCFNEFISSCDSKLIIGAWHHDISGSPERQDFISADRVKLLIDKGIRFCLHGHIHKTSLSPINSFASMSTSVPVVGVGSLCATGDYLPEGAGRQYNVVEFDDIFSKARIHVREMRGTDIFTSGRFDELGDSFFDFDLRQREIKMVEIIKGGSLDFKKIEMAEKHYKDGKYEDCLKLLSPEDLTQIFIREMFFESAIKTTNYKLVVDNLKEPNSISESSLLINALVSLKMHSQALVEIAKSETQFGANFADLKKRIEISERLKNG